MAYDSPLRDNITALMRGGTPPSTPSTAPSNLNQSPEASSAADSGNSQVPTSGGNAPATPPLAPSTPAASQTPQAANSQPDQPAQVAQPAAPATQAPLQLYGHSDMEQAKILTDWLKSQGAQVQAFDIGGSSRYDQEINGLIDQINNPAANDAQKRQLAQNLASLINLRNQGVQNSKYKYDPISGQFGVPTGAPGTRTSTDLIGGLDQPQTNSQNAPQGPPSQASTPNNSLLYQLINEQMKGGVTASPELGLAKSRLISDLEGSDATQRAEAAGRAGSIGATGGFLSNQLGNIEAATQKAKATGLSGIELGALDRQAASKQSALTALLQQSGLDASSAQQAASMLTQRQISQAQLASQQDQIAQNGQYQTASLGLQQRQQDIDVLIRLLEQARLGDENANARISDLLNKWGMQ